MCRNRLAEWATTAIMLGTGLTFIAAGGAGKSGLFDVLHSVGFDDHMLAGLFTGIGVMRIMALIANGQWPSIGPRMRAIGALLGAVIWAQMALALVFVFIKTDVVYLGISTWVVLAVVDFIACLRAASDARG